MGSGHQATDFSTGQLMGCRMTYVRLIVQWQVSWKSFCEGALTGAFRIALSGLSLVGPYSQWNLQSMQEQGLEMHNEPYVSKSRLDFFNSPRLPMVYVPLTPLLIFTSILFSYLVTQWYKQRNCHESLYSNHTKQEMFAYDGFDLVGLVIVMKMQFMFHGKIKHAWYKTWYKCNLWTSYSCIKFNTRFILLSQFNCTVKWQK